MMSSHSVPTSCKVHADETVTLFCYQHSMILCEKCLKEQHRCCRPVTKIENALESITNGIPLETVEKNIRSLNSALDQIIQNKDNNIVDLVNKQKTIKQTVQEARDRINSYLDKLVRSLELEFKTKHDLLIERIEKDKIAIKERKDALKSILDDINGVCYQTTDAQIHGEISKIQTKQKSMAKAIEEFISDQKQFELHLKLSETVFGFENIFLTMGSIVISEKPMNVSKCFAINVMQNGNGNIADGPKIQSIPNFGGFVEKSKLTLVSCFSTSQLGKGVKVFRACFLPDNNLMLAGYQEKSLYVCNKKGEECRKVRIANFPGGITLFNRTCALVSAWQHGIQKIDVINLKAGDILKLRGECSAISSFQNQICVKNGEDSLTVADINGKIVRRVPTMHNPWEIYLNDNGSIFYSNLENSNVHCVFSDGSNYLSYSSPELLDPAGLTVDNQDNLYITGSRSDNIHRVSGNREVKEIVLTREDGIISPSGIAFNKQTNELLIVNEDFSSIRIYKVHLTDE